MSKSVAQIAFEAHDNLTEWDDLPEPGKAAWRAVAQAVVRECITVVDQRRIAWLAFGDSLSCERALQCSEDVRVLEALK